jgi:hypothetical protein
MMNAIKKTWRISGMWHERMQIKTFKYADDMHKFLNRQYTNDWKESTLNLKTGIYAFAGGQWHNVKKLSPHILVHI